MGILFTRIPKFLELCFFFIIRLPATTQTPSILFWTLVLLIFGLLSWKLSYRPPISSSSRLDMPSPPATSRAWLAATPLASKARILALISTFVLVSIVLCCLMVSRGSDLKAEIKDHTKRQFQWGGTLEGEFGQPDASMVPNGYNPKGMALAAVEQPCESVFSEEPHGPAEGPVTSAPAALEGRIPTLLSTWIQGHTSTTATNGHPQQERQGTEAQATGSTAAANPLTDPVVLMGLANMIEQLVGIDAKFASHLTGEILKALPADPAVVASLLSKIGGPVPSNAKDVLPSVLPLAAHSFGTIVGGNLPVDHSDFHGTLRNVANEGLRVVRQLSNPQYLAADPSLQGLLDCIKAAIQAASDAMANHQITVGMGPLAQPSSPGQVLDPPQGAKYTAQSVTINQYTRPASPPAATGQLVRDLPAPVPPPCPVVDPLPCPACPLCENCVHQINDHPTQPDKPGLGPCPDRGFQCAECLDGWFCPPRETPAQPVPCGLGWPCYHCASGWFCELVLVPEPTMVPLDIQGSGTGSPPNAGSGPQTTNNGPNSGSGSTIEGRPASDAGARPNNVPVVARSPTTGEGQPPNNGQNLPNDPTTNNMPSSNQGSSPVQWPTPPPNPVPGSASGSDGEGNTNNGINPNGPGSGPVPPPIVVLPPPSPDNLVEGDGQGEHESSQSPSILGWNRLGCFQDSASRTLLGGRREHYVRGAMSNSFCVSHCRSKGYSFAGTEDGQECWCGTAMRDDSVRLHQSLCETPCQGALGTSCGGSWAISVYYCPVATPQPPFPLEYRPRIKRNQVDLEAETSLVGPQILQPPVVRVSEANRGFGIRKIRRDNQHGSSTTGDSDVGAGYE
ncbi:hypothetical protein ACJZ2D_001524 [Fusarium nematophilum]